MDLNAIELSDGFVYVVANKIKYNNKKYVQLMKIDGDEDFFFAENIGKQLKIVEDEDLKVELIKEIAKSMKEMLKKFNK